MIGVRDLPDDVRFLVAQSRGRMEYTNDCGDGDLPDERAGGGAAG